MALIVRGSSCCPICGIVIGESDQIVATTHFVGDENSSLWRYSDAAMHRECFLNWELRKQFIDEYNKTMGKLTWGNGTFHDMQTDGSILIRARKTGELVE